MPIEELLHRYILEHCADTNAIKRAAAMNSPADHARFHSSSAADGRRENYNTVEHLVRFGTVESAATWRFASSLRDGVRNVSYHFHNRQLAARRMRDTSRSEWNASTRFSGDDCEDVLIVLLREKFLKAQRSP